MSKRFEVEANVLACNLSYCREDRALSFNTLGMSRRIICFIILQSFLVESPGYYGLTSGLKRPEESRRCLEDLVGAPQLAHLTLKLFDALALGARESGP